MKTREKRKPRVALRFLLIFALLCILVPAAAVLSVNAWVKWIGGKSILSAEEASRLSDVDYILVLGCGVRSDGTPSPMLQDRLEQGVALFRSEAAPALLMSGDHGHEDYDEIGPMVQYAVSAGVSPQAIQTDPSGFSTYESITHAIEVFGAKKIIVVTQRYHLYRALYIAKQLGLEAYGVASDPRSYAGQLFRDFREVLARCKDFVTTIK